MSEIAATVIVPVDQVATARIIGASDPVNSWTFPRALTTDPTGPSNPAAEITDYGASGAGDAGVLALIVMLPGVVVDYTENWQAVLAANGRYIIADEI